MFRSQRSWRSPCLALVIAVLLAVTGSAAVSGPAATAAAGSAAASGPAAGRHAPKPTVVLVHGAFADASKPGPTTDVILAAIKGVS